MYLCVERGRVKHDQVTSNSSTNNMGITNTCFIDHLSFKIDERIGMEEIITNILSLNVDAFIEAYNNECGYNKAYRHRKLALNIYYNDFSDKKCAYIKFDGSACGELTNELQNIIQNAIQHNARFKRIDIGSDDFKGLLDINEISELAQNGHWTGKSHTSDQYERHDKSGESKGKTVYFGSRKSPVFIRIYDKQKQQEQDYHWIRCELEFKKDAADKVAQLIADTDNIGIVFSGIMINSLKFKIPSEDTNKSRWEDQEWWLDFIGDCEPLKLGKKTELNATEEDLSWLFRYSRPLHRLREIGGMDAIILLLEDGKAKAEKQQSFSNRTLSS